MTFRKKTDNKVSIVRIRFTPSEKETAQAYAKDAGLTLSGYLRKRALGMPVSSKTDSTIINELRRMGGMVKFLHNESVGAYSKETSNVLIALVEAIKRVGA